MKQLILILVITAAATATAEPVKQLVDPNSPATVSAVRFSPAPHTSNSLWTRSPRPGVHKSSGSDQPPVSEPEHQTTPAADETSKQEHAVDHLDGIETAADAIGWCESRDDYQAQNPASTASGRYQFINSTWQWVWEDLIGKPAPTERAKHADPVKQDRAFAVLWNDGQGASHWAPSEHCWEGRI